MINDLMDAIGDTFVGLIIGLGVLEWLKLWGLYEVIFMVFF